MEEDLNNYNGEDFAKINRRSKWKFIIGGLLLVVAIGVGLYFGYKRLNSNPVNIFKNAVNEGFDVLNKKIDDNKKTEFSLDLEKDPLVIELDTGLKSNIKELEKFTGYDYKAQIGLDKKDAKVMAKLGVKENNTDIVNILLNVLDNRMYLKSDEIFKNVIDLGEVETKDIFDIDVNSEINFDNEDIRNVVNSLKDIFIDSLDSNYFKLDKDKLKVKDKEIDVKKITYTLDLDNAKRTIEYIKERVSKDEKLLDTLERVTNIKKEDIKKSLEEEYTLDDYKTIKILLYTDKLNTAVGVSVFAGDIEYIKGTFKNKYLEMYVYKDKYVVEVKSEEKKTNIVFKESGTDILEVEVNNISDTKGRIEVEFSYEGIKGKGKIEYSNFKVTKDRINSDFILNMEVGLLGKNYGIELDGSISIGKGKIEEVDSTNSVKSDSLTEEEMTEVYKKLEDILKKFGLNDLLDM